jgi:hypothetical protein
MEISALSAKALYALFADPDSAQRGVDNLRAAGVTKAEITVISAEPFEDHEFSRRDRPTRIYWLAGAGGAIGLISGYFLTSATERAWPLPTGGMPIVSMWPNLVIMFELTMLFAILTTVAALLVTGRLVRRKSSLYDTEVSEGWILVGLERPDSASIDSLERALIAGGGRVKTIA